MRNTLLNREQISEERAHLGCLLAALLVVGICVGFAFPFRDFMLYSVSILLLAEDKATFGSHIYIDGRHVMTLTDNNETLHFRRGWHRIEVKKAGYQPAFLRFHATDPEQGSRTHFRLMVRGNRLLLTAN